MFRRFFGRMVVLIEPLLKIAMPTAGHDRHRIARPTGGIARPTGGIARPTGISRPSDIRGPCASRPSTAGRPGTGLRPPKRAAQRTQFPDWVPTPTASAAEPQHWVSESDFMRGIMQPPPPEPCPRPTTSRLPLGPAGRAPYPPRPVTSVGPRMAAQPPCPRPTATGSARTPASSRPTTAGSSRTPCPSRPTSAGVSRAGSARPPTAGGGRGPCAPRPSSIRAPCPPAAAPPCPTSGGRSGRPRSGGPQASQQGARPRTAGPCGLRAPSTQPCPSAALGRPPSPRRGDDGEFPRIVIEPGQVDPSARTVITLEKVRAMKKCATPRRTEGPWIPLKLSPTWEDRPVPCSPQPGPSCVNENRMTAKRTPENPQIAKVWDTSSDSDLDDEMDAEIQEFLGTAPCPSQRPRTPDIWEGDCAEEDALQYELNEGLMPSNVRCPAAHPPISPPRPPGQLRFTREMFAESSVPQLINFGDVNVLPQRLPPGSQPCGPSPRSGPFSTELFENISDTRYLVDIFSAPPMDPCPHQPGQYPSDLFDQLSDDPYMNSAQPCLPPPLCPQASYQSHQPTCEPECYDDAPIAPASPGRRSPCPH